MAGSEITPLYSTIKPSWRFSWGARNGIFYFLGNVPSHINHALPLYRSIGGTFIVLSKDAYDFCRKRGVDVICVDDQSDLFLQFSSEDVVRTVEYINAHAKVVIYYEVYPIAEIITVKQMMLPHGNSFKDYYIEWRQKYLPYYDVFAGLGPVWSQRTQNSGVPEMKVLDVGLARSDELISAIRRGRKLGNLANKLNYPRKLPVVCYMPTWWGSTSVNDVGKSLVHMISDEYVLLFRPHPSTPQELIDEYIEIIDNEKMYAYYVPEGNKWGIELNDILSTADAFIGDMSSVVIDALLTYKPILIAYGTGDRMQDASTYDPISAVTSLYPSITNSTVGGINNIIESALLRAVDLPAYDSAQANVMYGLDGYNVETTVVAIRELIEKLPHASTI